MKETSVVSLADSESSKSLMKTASSPASLTSGSPVKTASSPVSLASGSPVKTASSPVALTGGASTQTSAASSSVARGAQHVSAVLTPVRAGVVFAALGAGLYGVSNAVKYAQNKKSATQALKDTAKGAGGLGVSAGLGIAAGNAISGTALALGSTLVAPLAAVVVTASVTMRFWNKLFSKGESGSTQASS